MIVRHNGLQSLAKNLGPNRIAFIARQYRCLSPHGRTTASDVKGRRLDTRHRSAPLGAPGNRNGPQRHHFFSTSSIKASGTSTSESTEHDDIYLALLEALVQKRSLLSKQTDALARPEIAKEIGELEGPHDLWLEWKALQKTCESVLRMADPEIESDADMRQLAMEEARQVGEQVEELRGRIQAALLPRDASDAQSAIVEIRPGVGGDEAGVFAAQVARMYARFCEGYQHPDSDGSTRGFAVEQLSVSPIDVSTHNQAKVDAYKEVIMSVQGPGAYGLLRNEGGVHRVQRIPVTVNVPKLQTSAIAVIVLPSADEATGKGGGGGKTDEFYVDPKEVKEEVMRSRGAGGQHVNKTESAVRLTHEPTGITVSMQDSRSQHQNRATAWRVLRARLMDRKMREDQAQERSVRKMQVATMDRGDRIRTYNFPQDRVTDHRIALSTNNIDQIMEGDAAEGEGLHLLMTSLKDHFDEIALAELKQQIDQDIARLSSAP